VNTENYSLFRIIGRDGAYRAYVGHVQVTPHGTTRSTFPTQKMARDVLLSSLPGCLRSTPPVRWRTDRGMPKGMTQLYGDLTTNLGERARSEVARAYVRVVRSITRFGIDPDALAGTIAPMTLKRFATLMPEGDDYAYKETAEEVMEWTRTTSALRRDYARVLLAVEAHAIELAKSGTLRTHDT
jgi:hypothetical protein